MSICKQVILKMTFSSTDWQKAGQSAIYKRSRGFRPGITENKINQEVTLPFILLFYYSAYGKALKLQPECGSLWGDLGFNCFQQAKVHNSLSSSIPD